MNAQLVIDTREETRCSLEFSQLFPTNMSKKILLRIAAIVVFIHLLGHTIGHLAWDKPKDPKMNEVVMAMKGYSANFMGAVRSMADYYNGYSVIMFGVYVMTIMILWILSGAPREYEKLVNRLVLPMGVVYMFFAGTEFIFFFPFATTISCLAGLLMLLSVRAAVK